MVVARVMQHDVAPPSAYASNVPAKLDAVVCKSLALNPANRFATALEMALKLEEAVGSVSALEIATWVGTLPGEQLEARAQRIAEIERDEPQPSVSGLRCAAAEISAASLDARTAGSARAVAPLAQDTLEVQTATAVEVAKVAAGGGASNGTAGVVRFNAAAGRRRSTRVIGLALSAAIAVLLLWVRVGRPTATAQDNVPVVAMPPIAESVPVLSPSAIPVPRAPGAETSLSTPTSAMSAVPSVAPAGSPRPQSARPAPSKARTPFDVIGGRR
jgi:serine/threonine-protein kinase